MTWAPGDFPGRQMISGSIDVISNVILFFVGKNKPPTVACKEMVRRRRATVRSFILTELLVSE